MAEVKNSLKLRAATISIVLILAVAVIVLLSVWLKKQGLPDKNSVDSIEVHYEFQDGVVSILDVNGFYDSIKYDEWVKAKGYDKKFAAVGFVEFLPAKKQIEILGKDGNGSYLKIDGTVYLAPEEVYDYLTSFKGE